MLHVALNEIGCRWLKELWIPCCRSAYLIRKFCQILIFSKWRQFIYLKDFMENFETKDVI